MTNLSGYYDNERERILRWLRCLQEGLEPGRFRLCIKGNLARTNGKTGLGLSTYAMKILYQIGGMKHWKSEEIKEWIEFMQGFQVVSNNRYRGCFVDEYAMRRAFISNIPVYLLRFKPGELLTQNQRIVRAETRQAISTLLMVGSKSLYPVESPHKTPGDLVSWFEKLSWSNPWAAGSHASHTLFFHWYNGNVFNKPDNWSQMINEGFKFFDSIRAEDGGWYRGAISDKFKVNGAMKILTAYAWCNKDIERPEALIDLALNTDSWGDGCSIQNNLFVLQQASRFCSHRKPEIIGKAERILEGLDEYRNDDGGYSFYRGKAQTTIYGYRVSKGLCESDLHGTMMFTWTIATCLDLMGIAAEIGWSPQKP